MRADVPEDLRTEETSEGAFGRGGRCEATALRISAGVSGVVSIPVLGFGSSSDSVWRAMGVVSETMKTTPPPSPKRAIDLHSLSRAIVLVKSSRDRRNPPTAIRGTIRVYEANDGAATVKVELDYPQMFESPAHHRVITLTDAQVDELLSSENDGVYQVTVDEDLNPKS